MSDRIQKGEGSGQGSQTPLVEQLNAVPNDARIEYEHSPTHYQLIPVGRMCRDAAAEIASLREQLEVMGSAAADQIDRLRERLDEANEALRLCNGTCDLAIKHRDAAESLDRAKGGGA